MGRRLTAEPPETPDGPGGITTPVCLARLAVPAGTHRLALELTYSGDGYGVFSYLRAYRFRSRSATEVEVPEGALGVIVTSTGYENGSVTTPMEERPSTHWHVETTNDPAAGCTP